MFRPMRAGWTYFCLDGDFDLIFAGQNWRKLQHWLQTVLLGVGALPVWGRFRRSGASGIGARPALFLAAFFAFSVLSGNLISAQTTSERHDEQIIPGNMAATVKVDPIQTAMVDPKVQTDFFVENGTVTPALLSAYIANRDGARLQNPALIQANAMAFGRLSSPTIDTRIVPVQDPAMQQALSQYVSNAYVPTAGRLSDMQAQRRCLAQAVYHEARGEPEAGQWAVAAVILNRVASSRYPTTVCGVVFQNASQRNRCQFSFACDGQPDEGGIGNRIVRESWVKANLIADAAFRRFQAGERLDSLPSSALYYHSRSVQPSWASSMRNVAEIGQHIFYSAL